MTRRLTFETPYGCRWCGDAEHHHGSQWAPIVGMHTWIEPDPGQIKERMLRRRDHRLNREPAVYHVATGWQPDLTMESADPYCADCKTDACPRWYRIQARLNRERYGLPRRVRRSRRTSSGWGADLPF